MTENALIGRGDRNARKDDEPRVYHGTPERDAKTKVRGYVGMNNVRLVTIEYDGEYVDTVKERYYGVWLDLPCEREEAY